MEPGKLTAKPGRTPGVFGGWGERGFSLLEVLVAVTILAVGLLALARMQTSAVGSNSFSKQLTEATFLAQDKAEELRLLNECYVSVLAKPQTSWDENDWNIVSGYTDQLGDTQDNWTMDRDGDGIADEFTWTNADHTNADGSGIANPIDGTGGSVASGGYTREWCVVDDVPIEKTKTVHVRVTWSGRLSVASAPGTRQVLVKSVLSQ